MTEYRFRLDRDIDKKLIETITNRAGDGSTNLAAKQLLIEYHAIVLTLQRQQSVTPTSAERQNDQKPNPPPTNGKLKNLW